MSAPALQVARHQLTATAAQEARQLTMEPWSAAPGRGAAGGGGAAAEQLHSVRHRAPPDDRTRGGGAAERATSVAEKGGAAGVPHNKPSAATRRGAVVCGPGGQAAPAHNPHAARLSIVVTPHFHRLFLRGSRLFISSHTLPLRVSAGSNLNREERRRTAPSASRDTPAI